MDPLKLAVERIVKPIPICEHRKDTYRKELWAGYERGEYSAWQYNEALFTGFALPETELQDFLQTVELDPGARELIDWCRSRDVPFRVISDGFDHNLDSLQRIFGVAFDYTANSLRYAEAEGGETETGSGGWCISPGRPNPA